MNKAIDLSAPRTFDPLGFGVRVAQNQITLRLIRAIIVSFGVMIIAFFLLRLIPGDPVSLLLGDAATPESIEFYRKAMKLDGTLPEQLVAYIGSMLRGDLGTSIVTRASVNVTIARALLVTLWLILVTVTMALA